MRYLENILGLGGLVLAIVSDVNSLGFGLFCLGLLGVFLSLALNGFNNKRRGY